MFDFLAVSVAVLLVAFSATSFLVVYVFFTEYYTDAEGYDDLDFLVASAFLLAGLAGVCLLLLPIFA